MNIINFIACVESYTHIIIVVVKSKPAEVNAVENSNVS